MFPPGTTHNSTPAINTHRHHNTTLMDGAGEKDGVGTVVGGEGGRKGCTSMLYVYCVEGVVHWEDLGMVYRRGLGEVGW